MRGFIIIDTFKLNVNPKRLICKDVFRDTTNVSRSEN